MDQAIFELLEKKIEETDEKAQEEKLFYESLLKTIRLKDKSHLNDYLETKLGCENSAKLIYNFIVDFQRIVTSVSTLKLNSKFDFESKKDYLGSTSPLSTIALGMNMMLEELFAKMIPQYYFKEIFDLVDSPAILTDLYGRIRCVSDLRKLNIKLNDHILESKIIGIETIILEAFEAMNKTHKQDPYERMKNPTIVNFSNEKIEGFDVKVKHLYSQYLDSSTEGFLFVFVPSEK